MIDNQIVHSPHSYLPTCLPTYIQSPGIKTGNDGKAHYTLSAELPGPPQLDTQEAVLVFPMVKEDETRMPVQLYRVIITARVTGVSLSYSVGR